MIETVRKKRWHGQAIVEFALVLPVLLLLMLGLINLVLLINSQIILTHASWEGARAGATLDPSQNEGDANIQGAVQNSLIGLVDPLRVLIVIDPDEADRKAMTDPLPRGHSLKVSLIYPISLALPMPISLSLTAEATSRIEYSNPP